MVWGFNKPSSSGKASPEGYFEDNTGRFEDGWDDRLKDHYAALPLEDQRALCDFGDLDPEWWAHLYPYYITHKMIDERGARGPDARFPRLSPIRPHEPPIFLRCYPLRTLGSFMFARGIPAVDEALKEIIERLEPGLHEFFPLEIRNHKNEISDHRFYTLHINQYLNSFSPEDSDPDIFRDNGNYGYISKKSKAGITGLALKKDVFSDAHLWFERELNVGNQPVCLSDELQAAITDAGLWIPKHYRMREV